MRFRSELLQPPTDDSEATITRIHEVYRTPEGTIEGEDESIAELLERGRPRQCNLPLFANTISE